MAVFTAAVFFPGKDIHYKTVMQYIYYLTCGILETFISTAEDTVTSMKFSSSPKNKG